jgi:hypothetical protein
LALCACPQAAAREAGWRAEIPLGGLPARLDQVDSGKTLDLIAVADGNYTLALVPLRMEGKSWVRAVLTKGTGFFGMCTLATREEFGRMEALAVDIEAGGALRFSVLPEGKPLAAFEIPITLEGECRLLPLAQSQGVTVAPVDAPPPGEEPTLPASASTAQPEGPGGPPALRLPPGAYALALLAVALALAALVFGKMHWRRVSGIAAALWAKRPRGHGENIFARAEEVDPVEDTREIPLIAPGPVLPGLRVADAGGEGLVRRITMRAAWETAAEPGQGITPEQVNGYFLGRGALPAGGRFRTVGLRNRDALQQLGGGSVRPLFAPNPRGQIFSLEEESGGLYLHVDYFAPPSFLLQPVLRSVCLECVFALEDARGNPLRLENVLGHAVLGIAPARTARTESGFIVTEKGRLVIGEN